MFGGIKTKPESAKNSSGAIKSMFDSIKTKPKADDDDMFLQYEDPFMREMSEISKDRGEEYGSIEDSFGMIASMWGKHLKVNITAKDVPVMMIMLKLSRLAENLDHHDSYIDIANYAKIADALK